MEKITNSKKWVTVTYNATVTADVRVPEKWDIEKIKEELADGPCDLDREDEDSINFGKIIELIVDGIVVIKK